MKITIILSLLLIGQLAVAQNRISGQITNQENSPLVGVQIFAPESNKGTSSDSLGHFELNHLPNGKVRIQFSLLGYTNKIETFTFTGQPIKFNIRLNQTSIEAEEIVVSGGYNSTQHGNAVKIDVLSLSSRSLKNTPNFAETLTTVPGVDMISKGNGVSKPVIRGLSMNDILILNNGVRYENYQYSSHHPLGIDEYGIEDIEIIKGPASLLYGSDAIGGVINFIKEKPAAIGDIEGDYNLQMFSNSLGIANNLGVKAASKNLFGGIRVGQKSNADYKEGGGMFVPNSRFNEWSVKANTGFTNDFGTYKLFYDYNDQKLGLVEDEAIESITERGRKNSMWYQALNTHLLSSQNKLFLDKFKLDLNLSFQNTELTHFGEPHTYEIQMNLATINYEAKLHLPSQSNSEYTIGIHGFNQKNKNLSNRKTILLPDASTNNYAVFGLVQHTYWEKLKIQSGLRYDNKNISTVAIGTPEKEESYCPKLEKSYKSLSGSLGATFHLSEQLLFRANWAAAYRTPNLAELTSNGQHELRYELGNEKLLPEKAYESDISLHYHTTNLTFDLAGFYNRINDYIFIAPTGKTTISGIGIYHYKQANSFLWGGETGLHLHPGSIKWMHFETTLSTVTGQQKSGEYLPFIPAPKCRVEFRAETEKLFFIKKSYASIITNSALKQNKPAPEETATNGYTIIDIILGGNLQINQQAFALSISANNLFDIKYIDHLSTLKEVNRYNPGRNIAVSLKIPF